MRVFDIIRKNAIHCSVMCVIFVLLGFGPLRSNLILWGVVFLAITVNDMYKEETRFLKEKQDLEVERRKNEFERHQQLASALQDQIDELKALNSAVTNITEDPLSIKRITRKDKEWNPLRDR